MPSNQQEEENHHFSTNYNSNFPEDADSSHDDHRNIIPIEADISSGFHDNAHQQRIISHMAPPTIPIPYSHYVPPPPPHHYSYEYYYPHQAPSQVRGDGGFPVHQQQPTTSNNDISAGGGGGATSGGGGFQPPFLYGYHGGYYPMMPNHHPQPWPFGTSNREYYCHNNSWSTTDTLTAATTVGGVGVMTSELADTTQNQIFQPGPPIQMVADGLGPDGCNLFIFHVPNEMTNLDLFNIFSPFGTVISARIMVDNDTGRSRGFGFVSFDDPTSASDAILQMNRLQIGNKRLKVQYKKDKVSVDTPGYGPEKHHNGRGGTTGKVTSRRNRKKSTTSQRRLFEGERNMKSLSTNGDDVTTNVNNTSTTTEKTTTSKGQNSRGRIETNIIVEGVAAALEDISLKDRYPAGRHD